MKKDNSKIEVVCAMSGGVDSSVSAALLKQAGFDVVGVMAKFWKDGESSAENRCCSVESEKLARLVCGQLEIPFYVVNLEREFKKAVVYNFLAQYRRGATPNPCVVCNKEIKFGLLLRKAEKMGADFLATGHYVRIENGRMMKGKDKSKDQSYFLWQLGKKQLEKILFPVGGYTKAQVRQLAKEFDLVVAETPESQEVCFVPDTANNFLAKYLKQKPGKIIDKKGKVLGQHQGLWFYTIGQRKGLELPQGPWFVVAKDFKKNTLVVSKNKRDLYKKELKIKDINWIGKKSASADVKIRYKSGLAKAKISGNKIIFQKSQLAITPGQSAVLYKGNELLGGGIIQ
ncbi:MAG TPA: tRNA 2-thiouridine(34) synthase MnmA [Candidatus Staskawiczbacteria bacterium]|nr:tRNA 2-thiouridine(34) synthase MnmA [Candidatus Staskawiczbacteria bacterium]